MEELSDLDLLEIRIRDLQGRIRTLQIAITKNEEEMLILKSLQETLKENIVELKNAPISLAHEFKKAKDDLKRTHVRMSFLIMDRATLGNAFAGQSGLLVYLQKEYDELLYRIENNVIQGDFRRKNGR